MASKDLKGLREHLFDTIERLKDKDNPMEVDRAKAVAQVAGVILDSAKVEIGYMRATGAASESDFISTPEPQRRPRLPGRTPQAREISGEKTEATLPGQVGGVRNQTGLVACLDCGEKFPDAKAMGIHKTRVHFNEDSEHRK